MNKIYSLLASVALMSAFTACSSDDEMPSQMANVNGTELAVESVGVAGVSTKSGITAASFNNGETLGLYIYRGSDAAAIDGATRNYNDATSTGLLPTVNVPYQQGLGTGGSWGAAQKIILSNVQGTVYAYYPYSATNTDATSTAIPIKVAADQGSGQTDGIKDYTESNQYDYMWATPVAGRSNKKPNANLIMNHALAMISFKFVQTADNTVLYPGLGHVTKIVLKNKTGKSAIKTGNATMNIKDGTLDQSSAVSTSSITLSPNQNPLIDVVAPAKLPRLLIYPNTGVAADDAEVTFTVDGYDYTLDIPVLAEGWKAGSNYLYTITMKGTALEIKNVSITEWAPKTGNATDMNVVTPDGSDLNP